MSMIKQRVKNPELNGQQIRVAKQLWTPPQSPVRGERVMDVGSELAAHFLKFNVKNRDLRQTHADSLARDMISGRWEYAGDPIRFDANGNLIDGQHRLVAIVQAQVTMPMLVVWGLSPESQSVIDTGKVRSIQDALLLSGTRNARTIATSLRYLYMWDSENGLVESKRKSTHAELRDLLAQNPKMEPSVDWVHENKQVGLLLTNGAAAFLFFLFDRIDAEDCREFFGAVSSGANLTETDPRLMLRNTVENCRLRGGKISHTPFRMVIPWTIKAWNAWRSDMPVRLLRYGKSEQYPIPH